MAKTCTYTLRYTVQQHEVSSAHVSICRLAREKYSDTSITVDGANLNDFFLLFFLLLLTRTFTLSLSLSIPLFLFFCCCCGPRGTCKQKKKDLLDCVLFSRPVLPQACLATLASTLTQIAPIANTTWTESRMIHGFTWIHIAPSSMVSWFFFLRDGTWMASLLPLLTFCHRNSKYPRMLKLKLENNVTRIEFPSCAVGKSRHRMAFVQNVTRFLVPSFLYLFLFLLLSTSYFFLILLAFRDSYSHYCPLVSLFRNGILCFLISSCLMCAQSMLLSQSSHLPCLVHSSSSSIRFRYSAA
ncbi:MAG: hypothetical protein BYD32DRAFT_128161 [Podila humilis]|nr:MAG: hypothetical protein BYD32DRAFT_128161 [Podila humilis]